MKITDEIREAIDKACMSSKGGASHFAKETGFTQAQISKYRRGFITDIADASWEKLSPHLAPYLPQAPKDAYDAKLDAVKKIVDALEPFDGLTAKQILKAAIQLSGIESI